IAGVRREPVVFRPERPADADLRRLVARARDDERSATLPVQDLEAVVDLAAEQDVAEPLFERLLVEVGVPPRDRLLVVPVRAERRAFRPGYLRHRPKTLDMTRVAVHAHRSLHHGLAQRR